MERKRKLNSHHSRAKSAPFTRQKRTIHAPKAHHSPAKSAPFTRQKRTIHAPKARHSPAKSAPFTHNFKSSQTLNYKLE